MVSIKNPLRKAGAVILLGLISSKGIAQSDSLNTVPSPIETISNIEQADVSFLSLEDLMNVNVTTGSLVKTKQFATPVSVTLITEADIKISGARNLLDLMEVYVPGFFWMDHPSESVKTGMRGITSDRNLKMLLLVNGVIINDRGHKGAFSELTNWDLNDIEKIEVIRGPGSVTYGPGAIQGVISITTKRASNGNSTSVNANYVGAYNSKGISIHQNLDAGKVKVALYGSIQATEGADNKLFKVNDTKKYGYLGEVPGTITPNRYMADGSAPQLKLFADFDLSKGFKFYTRYNQVTNNSNFYEMYKPLSSVNPKATYNGTPIQSSLLKNQQYFAMLEKKIDFNKNFSLNANLIYDNENNVSYRFQAPAYTAKTSDSVDMRFVKSVIDLDNLRHANYSYSEEQITGRVVGYYHSNNEKFQAALGGDIVKNTWRAPWGQNDNMLRMGDQKNILSDSLSSGAIGPDALATGGWIKAKDGIYVGNGWSTTTVSVYGEAKYSFSPLLTIIGSNRVDKDTYSKWLFSPRIAFISELNSKHNIRLVFLQSNRMNTGSQMLLQHMAGVQSRPEKLKGTELIYTYIHNSKIIGDLSAFYSENEVLSWSSNLKSVLNTGKSNTGGLEASIGYTAKNIKISINHSYVKLFGWDMSSEVTASGISYADFRQPVTYTDANKKTQTVYINGAGNNLSNYANNITKLIANYSCFKERLTLHADSRILWGYAGMKDGLKAYENAFDTVSAPIKTEITKLISDLRARDMYGIDIRVNLSVSYKITPQISVMVFANNIFSSDKTRRYFYDSGLVSATAPSKIGYVAEPRFFGAKMSYKF